MIDSLVLTAATRSSQGVANVRLPGNYAYIMESAMPRSGVMHSALPNRSILSSVNPCTIRVSHTGNSGAEEPDLSIGDFLF